LVNLKNVAVTFWNWVGRLPATLELSREITSYFGIG